MRRGPDQDGEGEEEGQVDTGHQTVGPRPLNKDRFVLIIGNT